MKAEEFVKQHLPTARAERHLQGRIKGMQKVYWLIRELGNSMYYSEGKSESNAWVNAKERLLRELKTKEDEYRQIHRWLRYEPI